MAVMYLAFGFDDITSAELLQVAFDLWGLDAMGVLGFIVLSAGLSFLAACCFALFVSLRFKSPLALAAAAAQSPVWFGLTVRANFWAAHRKNETADTNSCKKK